MPKNIDSETLDAKMFEINKLYLKSSGLWQKCEQMLGLNHYTSNVLYFLHTFPDTTQKQISQSFDIPKQTINNVILSLHKQGFVEFRESANDRREKILCLTQEGKEYANTLLDPILAFNKSVLLRMGSKKVENLIKSWQDFYGAFLAELNELKEAKSAQKMHKEAQYLMNLKECK